MAVGRFQVMAVLQAARAFVLGMSIESAKSFGLNRAIFYAAAKKGFKGGTKKTPRKFVLTKKPLCEKKAKEIEKTFKITTIGDEMAYSIKIDRKEFFVIGDEIQSPEDFERQIESRFGNHFKRAWEEAVMLCKDYDRGVLTAQRYFYETVYKPRRDELAKKWSEIGR